MSYETPKIVETVLEDDYIVKTKRISDGTISRDILVNGSDVDLDEVWSTDLRAGRNIAQILEAHRGLYNNNLTILNELSTEFKIRRMVR